MPRHRHVLVIDDDPLFRSLVVAALKEEFTVSVAAGGADGYYQALQQRPDLVLLDIQMRGWHGLQTLKNFKSHSGLRDIPVVMLTSDGSAATTQEATTAGAADYLVKTDYSKAELTRKLLSLLADQRLDEFRAPDSRVTAGPVNAL